MDLAPIGTELRNVLPALSRIPGAAPSDTSPGTLAFLAIHEDVAVVVRELADPAIVELLNTIERGRLEQDPSILEQLVRTAAEAAQTDRTPLALESITRLATLNPEVAVELIRREESLAPLQDKITSALQHLSSVAKSDAERTLLAAAQGLRTAAPLTDWGGIDARQVLHVAERFLESGQHINFVRATELGQVLLGYMTVPQTATLSACRDRDRRPAGIRKPAYPRSAEKPDLTLRTVAAAGTAIWRRAPLLVLLSGWLLLGAVGALLLFLGGSGAKRYESVGADIWAVALLALVVFQFVVTIRSYKTKGVQRRLRFKKRLRL